MPQDGFGGNKSVRPLDPEREQTLAGSMVEGAVIGPVVVAAGLVVAGAESARRLVVKTREQIVRFGDTLRHFAQEMGDGGEASTEEPRVKARKLSFLEAVGASSWQTGFDKQARKVHDDQPTATRAPYEPISYQRRR